MKNKICIVLFVQFFLVSHFIIGQGLKSDQIDSIVSRSIERTPQAGIAVAVVKDGIVVHSKGYGVISISTGQKINENTLFAIASNSKSFTTTALAILIDEGKLNWNDKVVDHIPEFKMYNPYVTAEFNIQDLLTHRCGLGEGVGDLMYYPDGADFTIKDVINSFQYQKPVSAFRTKYDYDNMLYVVAGEVIARVSGMSWDEFVENKIMKPIGMTRSAGLYENLKDKSNVAIPHFNAHGALRESGSIILPGGDIYGASGIYSSVNDMSKWLLLHLNEGKFGKDLTHQLVSGKNHAELWKPYTNISFNVKPSLPYRSHFAAYGLGWDLADQNGYIIVEHSGGLPGMLSRAVLIPELNVGIVVLTNTDPGGYSVLSISSEILDSFIGVPRKDWITEIEDWVKVTETKGDSVTNAVWNTVSNAKSDHLNFNDYIGTYKDNWFGNVEIFLKDGKLWFKALRSPKLTGEMCFYKSNTFAIKWKLIDMPCDAFAIFNLDENGKAIGIKMKAISPNIDFSFDFQDLDLRRVEN